MVNQQRTRESESVYPGVNIPISEVWLERLGTYYTSEYVKTHQPWIREIPFARFVEREWFKRQQRLQRKEDTLYPWKS